MVKKYTTRKKCYKKRNNSYKNTKSGGSLGGKFVLPAGDKSYLDLVLSQCKATFNLNKAWWREITLNKQLHGIKDPFFQW